MFGNKLASFITFPRMGETSLGELTFTDIQLPFKKLDIANNQLKPYVLRTSYDFVLSLDHGQRIVFFTHYNRVSKDQFSSFTLIISCDRHGRLINLVTLGDRVIRENVSPCGPDKFILYHYKHSPELVLFNSGLRYVENIAINKSLSNVCCSSKFVFGLLSRNSLSDDGDNPQGRYSYSRIQVCHLETLREAFCLRVPAKYRIERILADEHHLVAMTRRENESDWAVRQWSMGLFDLQAIGKESGRDKGAEVGKSASFFLIERHIDLTIESHLLPSHFFLFDGWLVVPQWKKKKLVWFDKNGRRSETSTEWDSENLSQIYSSGLSLLFSQPDGKLWL